MRADPHGADDLEAFLNHSSTYWDDEALSRRLGCSYCRASGHYCGYCCTYCWCDACKGGGDADAS